MARYTYGATNARLVAEEWGVRTYYAWEGGQVMAEFQEGEAAPTTPQWLKNYIYLGARLLATQTAGSGSQVVQYHHPDRLGTRLVTNAADSGSFEQVSLPYGVALGAESTGATNRRFTSYERSGATGLDYAINRHYDPLQGRFTQVDPIEMDAVDLTDPQTLNMYAYCGNDPVNYTDPAGLFFKKLFKAIWKVITSKAFIIAATVALAVITIGSAAGWWALSVTKGISISTGTLCTIGAAGCLGGAWAVTQTTTLGWVAAGLSTALAIPALGSIEGILGAAAGYGVGRALSGLGGVVGPGGTPDWNPGNEFQRRNRRDQPRPGQPGYRGPGSWHYGTGRPPIRRLPPPVVGYSSRYPRDIPGGRETYREVYFRSEGEARVEALRKIGPAPVQVEQGKWRSFNGRWQYRAKPGDLRDNHVHLERLDPATGQVLENWHFRYPAGTGRQ